MPDRPHVIASKLSDDELAALKAIMRKERRNQSETIRELIRAEAKRRGLWAPVGTERDVLAGVAPSQFRGKGRG
jgi:hypothetical protein